MKNQIKIISLLLLFTFLLSCQEQAKTEQVKEKISQPEQIETKASAQSDTINSPYAPNTITRNIIQDKKGNYWLATWDGIIQYDGKNFINFTKKHDLIPARIFTILEDKSGKIWFGTVGSGIYLYDGNSFIHITTKDGIIGDSIGCFMEDKAGNIWIGTQGGISKYDGKSFTNFIMKGSQINSDINSIVEDKTGKFWFGTRGNAFTFDGKKFTTVRNETGTPFVNVRSVIEDGRGNIWFGGGDGLWSNNGMMWSKVTSNFVGYIYEDKRGNIWTSSEGNLNKWALSRYNGEYSANKELIPTQIKSANDMYFGIMEDDIGNIWWGSLQGIHRYNGLGFEDFQEEEGIDFEID